MQRKRPIVHASKTTVTVIAVATFSAVFAWAFRELILSLLSVVFGDRSSIHSVRMTNRFVIFIAISAALFIARWIGQHSRAQTDGVGGSMLRAIGTFVASVTAGSIGRETAIIDTGRSIGAASGSLVGIDRESTAMVGVAAAFAAAYHAPFAGVAYVASHFGHRRHPRVILHAVAGALIGDFVMVDFLNGHPLFPKVNAPVTDLLLLGAIGFIPAVIGARIFLWTREEILRSAFVLRHQRRLVPCFILISAGTVALVPLAAGNGMEAIRTVAVGASATAALSLSLAKLVATAGAVGSRTPGGIFSPTLAVSAGWAALAFSALNALGVNMPAATWPGLLVAMAVGATIGLRSRVLGAIVVAEMIGQVQYIPVFAIFAVLAGLVTRRTRTTTTLA